MRLCGVLFKRHQRFGRLWEDESVRNYVHYLSSFYHSQTSLNRFFKILDDSNILSRATLQQTFSPSLIIISINLQSPKRL